MVVSWYYNDLQHLVSCASGHRYRFHNSIFAVVGNFLLIASIVLFTLRPDLPFRCLPMANVINRIAFSPSWTPHKKSF